MVEIFKYNKTLLFITTYIVTVFWIQYLAKDSSTLIQLKKYVVARCQSQNKNQIDSYINQGNSEDLEQSLLKCNDLDLKILGVWGGFYGKPNLHVKVIYPSPALSEEKYYTIRINPTYGFNNVVGEIKAEDYYYKF